MTLASARIECTFRFKCPKVWHLLTPTAVDTVRHCGVCERDVFLVRSDDELRTHAAAGHCVAVPVLNATRRPEEPESLTLGEVVAPYDSTSRRDDLGTPP